MIGPDEVSILASINACDKGAWQIGMALFIDSGQWKLHPNTFTGNALLSAYSSSTSSRNPWQTGLRLLKLLQEVQVTADVVSFNIVLSMLGRANAWHTAVDVLALMADSHSATTSHLNSVMGCLAKVQQWEQAVFLLQQSHERTIEADTATYSYLIEACRDWTLALRTFEMSKELEVDASRAVPSSGRRSWQKDLTHMVSTLARHEISWQLGAQCVQRLQSLGLQANGVTLTSLLHTVKPGRWPMALHMLRSSSCLSLPPNDFSRSAALTSLGPGRQWRSVAAIFRQMARENLEVNQAWVAAAFCFAAFFFASYSSTVILSSQVCCGAALRGFERQSLWRRSLWLLRMGCLKRPGHVL